jgi:threonyl-tRNA synthetase
MEYSAEDGTRKQPIMVHRALLGSLERFFGVLIEHYAGNFPVWLAPEQVRVLPVTDDSAGYADKVLAGLKGAGLRAQIDKSGEKVGKKIRDAESMKVPFMVVVGKLEADAGQVALRRHKVGDLGKFSLQQAIDTIKEEETQKKI